MQIKISDYPQLSSICWNLRKDSVLTEEEALAIYERNWRYADHDNFSEKEKSLIDYLVRKIGKGVMNV